MLWKCDQHLVNNNHHFMWILTEKQNSQGLGLVQLQ